MFFRNDNSGVIIKQLEDIQTSLTNLYTSVVHPMSLQVNSIEETLNKIEQRLVQQQQFNHNLEIKYTELIFNIQNFLAKFEEILKGVKGIKVSEIKQLKPKKTKKKL